MIYSKVMAISSEVWQIGGFCFKVELKRGGRVFYQQGFPCLVSLIMGRFTFFFVLFILSGILQLELDHLKPPDRNGKKAWGLQRGLSVLLLHPSFSFSCLGRSCDHYRGSFIN